MALSALVPVDCSRRGWASRYAVWLVAIPLQTACIGLDPDYVNPLTIGATGTSSVFTTTGATMDASGTVGETQGWSSMGADPGTSTSGIDDDGSTSSTGDAGTTGDTVESSTDGATESESSTGPVEPLPPDCRSPARLHAYSGELWDAEPVGSSGVVLSQRGDETLWQRFDADGAMSAEPLVYAEGIRNPDLLAVGNDTFVAYEAETVEGRVRTYLMLNGDGPDPQDDRILSVTDQDATSHSPRLAFGREEDTGEAGGSLLVGYIEESSGTPRLHYGGYVPSTGTRRIGTSTGVGSGSGAPTLRHWIYPPGQGGGTSSSMFGLVQGERDVVHEFGVNAHVVSGSVNVPLRDSVLIAFGSAPFLIGINNALDRLEMTAHGSMSTVDIAPLDAENETCSHTVATHDGSAVVAAVMCTRNGRTRIRVTTLNGEIEDPAPVAVDVLDEPREVLDHRIVFAAERLWSVWMEPSGLWIAPICLL